MASHLRCSIRAATPLIYATEEDRASTTRRSGFSADDPPSFGPKRPMRVSSGHARLSRLSTSRRLCLRRSSLHLPRADTHRTLSLANNVPPPPVFSTST
jgi:hypothetical protein